MRNDSLARVAAHRHRTKIDDFLTSVKFSNASFFGFDPLEAPLRTAVPAVLTQTQLTLSFTQTEARSGFAKAHNLRHTASFHDPAKTRNQPPKQIFYLLFNKIARMKYKWITPEDHESIRNRQTQSTLTLRRQHRSSVTFKQIQEYQHVDRRSPFQLFSPQP